MGVSQSDLSDPHYGFDLVVAVTQASVNATMTQLMAGLTEPVVTLCYVHDDSNTLVPIDYETLKANAKGSDPFHVAAGADPAINPDLINLAAAKFAGAVQAQIGLPDVPFASLPPIVTLGAEAGDPVVFNLLCSTFQVVGFVQGPQGAVWIDHSQPSGSGPPWFFSAKVSLNAQSAAADPSMPANVRARIQDLQRDTFSLQKLSLDLDTAVLLSSPTIEGVPEGSPLWTLISSVFLGAYFTQLRQNGDPVLSYSFTINDPGSATLQLGAVSRECQSLLQNGQPITQPTMAQANAATLIYIGTQSTTPPIPTPFTWNWVELNEVSDLSGVQAVRRDVFLADLANLINPGVYGFSIDPKVDIHGEAFSLKVNYSSQPVLFCPAVFKPIWPTAAPGPDGFTDLMSINWVSNAKGSGASLATVKYQTSPIKGSGEFNYTVAGQLAVKGNQIRVTIRAQAYMSFNYEFQGVTYPDLVGRNYYDKTLIATYSMAVDKNGALRVTANQDVVDRSSPWSFARGNISGDGVEAGLTSVETSLAQHIDSTFVKYADGIASAINGYGGWVFPGNGAFTFKNVAFSDSQDLTVQLTYANPN